jgi:hypothetical protein
VQLARSRGITTINIVKSSTDEEEMVALLKSLGGDVVCQPHHAVSHRFKDLISDLKKPVLAIHYADKLDVVELFNIYVMFVLVLLLSLSGASLILSLSLPICLCFFLTGFQTHQIYHWQGKHENVSFLFNSYSFFLFFF